MATPFDPKSRWDYDIEYGPLNGHEEINKKTAQKSEA